MFDLKIIFLRWTSLRYLKMTWQRFDVDKSPPLKNFKRLTIQIQEQLELLKQEHVSFLICPFATQSLFSRRFHCDWFLCHSVMMPVLRKTTRLDFLHLENYLEKLGEYWITIFNLNSVEKIKTRTIPVNSIKFSNLMLIFGWIDRRNNVLSKFSITTTNLTCWSGS